MSKIPKDLSNLSDEELDRITKEEIANELRGRQYEENFWIFTIFAIIIGFFLFIFLL